MRVVEKCCETTLGQNVNNNPSKAPNVMEDPKAAPSKNAIKKAERLKRIIEGRRAQRKAKKDLAKRNKRELVGNATDDEKRISKKEAISIARQKLKEAQVNADATHLRVCIDLQFEALMNDKELTHLASQLSRTYGANKKASKPCQLTFSSLKSDSKTYKICSSKCDGFANYFVNQSEKPVDELFEKESIVYLTPDSDQVLEEIDVSSVYVIGGLVDDSVKKHSSLTFAESKSIKTFKLPIVDNCQRSAKGTYKQILTINQVFEILIGKFAGLSWADALEKSLPQRIGFVAKRE